MKISKSIRFTKASLEKIKHTDKLQKFFDLTCEGLCIYIQPLPSLTKSYYAHWGLKSIKEDGTQKTSGRQRYICRYGQKPIDVVKRLVNIKLPEWKKTNSTSSSIIKIEDLVKDYLSNGLGGYRIKSKGSKIKYKKKTSDHYEQLLKAYVLAKTKKQQLKDMLTGTIRLSDNTYYKKQLAELPLDKITKSDIETWHNRMELIPLFCRSCRI
jgi:hypothetical protein